LKLDRPGSIELIFRLTGWQAAEILDKALVGWDALPTGVVSLDWGTNGILGRRSLLALVPSVIVEEEYDVPINPLHPDAGQVAARKNRKWTDDSRLRARAMPSS